MRIVVFNTVPYGSTGTIAQNIAKEATSQGYEVYFVRGWTKKRKLKNNNENLYNTCIATNFVSKLIHVLVGKITGFDGCFSLFHTLLLIKKLKKIKPDIIHMHIMHDYFLCLPILFMYIKKEQVKVVWTFHDCWAFTGGCPYFDVSGCEKWKYGCKGCGEKKKYGIPLFNAPSKMWNLKVKMKCKIKNMVITAPSYWLANLVHESFYSDFDIRVVRNGIDLSKFTPVESQFRNKYKCQDKYIVLGVAFDWGERKGLDVFNELANLLPERYQIVLVGTNDNIDRMIDKRIISIHKTNYQEELIKIYSAADVFVNPTREEVFGMVNIEALACGTPVITFDTGGAPEGIDGTCGVVVHDKNAHALLPHILDICEKHLFSKEACIKRASKFDEKTCYQDYIEIYNELVHG